MFAGIDRPVVLAATSDLHGYLEGIQEVCASRTVDVLVIAGDIEPADIYMSKPYWFEHTFFPVMGRLDCEVIAIPGNHDFYLASHYSEIRRNEKGRIPKNFHLLIDEPWTARGLSFYGTPWVPYINGRWCFEAEDADLAGRFNQMPEDVDVLITHSPPQIKHRNLDISLDNPPEYRRHYGSRSLAKTIQVKWPKTVFCGHIHSGDHDVVALTNGKDGLGFKWSQIWNVSRVNENYDIGYSITVVTLFPDGSVGQSATDTSAH